MFDPDFITNPYRAYDYLRTAAPLHWTDKFRSGAWFIPRYADVEKFRDPQHLEITRDEGIPLSFGHGTHFCIGAALAYTEAEIAFTTLLERTSSLRMLEDVPAWRPNMAFRGLSRLRLSLVE